ncbi:hypothetical protein FRB99_004719 [Tulasnella sp. 403]|nr:hypothetical protein FRB99_004719 [Tulasnella sp. 403]
MAAVIQARSPPQSKAVIVQMFEWTWDSIATECKSFLGPAGYGYVQVSPPANHIQGSQWWTDYQPISYTLTSKRGTRSQFGLMINACHQAGVGVIVDTIWNHMSALASGTGYSGQSFTKYNYPGIYMTQDFHHNCASPDGQIHNYGNRSEVQFCELVGLADLATETEHVRTRLAAYANDLLSLKADGFRLDAAKHIPAADIANILSRLSRSVYVTQESNHDTERNGNSLNYRSPNNAYTLATIFSLSFPYGTPTVLSSYQFSNSDDGAPDGGAGTCSSNGGTNGWNCQHRWLAISGLVGFFNKVTGTTLNNWVVGSSSQIAYGRGSVGFVVINNSGSPWTKTFTTSLPDGNYCDVVHGMASSGKCSANSVKVTGHVFTAVIPAFDALVIHTGVLGTGTATPTTTTSPTPTAVSISFHETATTVWGENIFLVGSLSQLGSWNPNSAIPLSSASYPVWAATVSLPPKTTFQYKYIRKSSSGAITWESDPNRSYMTPASGSGSTSDSWR